MFRLRKRKSQEILQNYKKAKRSEFDFERIVLLFSNKEETDAHQVLPYSTLQDLDFEELFMYLDRTCSKIGQQYLYTILRTIPKDKNRSLHYERIIKYFNDNPEIKESSVLEISRLNKHGAYFLQSLFLGKNIAKPGWFWIVPFLSGLSIVSLLISFIFPVFLLFFLPILCVNFIFHYWNKKNVLTYSNSLPQLLTLNQVAKELLRSGVILDTNNQVQSSIDSTDKIAKRAILFNWESEQNSEIGEITSFLSDLIKASFGLEPIFMFKIIGDLELKKTQISKVFNAVAQVDVALSISSFREGLPYYALPDIKEKKKSFYASGLYHPLIRNSVANDIDLSDGKSVLISGSNMSGKTTFIRTIGINTILAQTINTVCAKQFVAPRLKVHSAIQISDNLLDDTSYYYKEVKTIKKMIAESESDHQNIFLLDELFKGTNTVERISSGKAVLSYLNRKENLVIVSTHDIELTELLNDTYNYFHFVETIENDLLMFDYKLKDGKSMNTNAIRILEINKFPKEITNEAKSLAKKIGK